ncbi:alpha/beta fold hydrolase [uncultured Eudoraea sp.]|uniref:alpha/beta hydrolase n=1 Tax=uncultured Eudoraea sp. TaxID=1035614 RepID=UPI00261BDCFC|nr:alpha/beta fold hydrolase [uncultured Eudoraea sp.]
MSLYKTTFYMIAVFVLSSCSFNSTFHKPNQIKSFEELTRYDSVKDTTYIEYAKESQEIILYEGEYNKVINRDYIIRNKFFVSSNGNKLNGWLLTPKKVKPIATILHLHGSAGNLLTQYELITPLIEYGYQIFTFDYSGYGCSEGEPTHENLIQDGYSALKYINEGNGVHDGRLILYGQSYGGYLASIIGSNSQQEMDGIVIEGAFSSFREEAKHKAGFFGNFVKIGIRADREIQKNQKPVLIIHSKEDKMVPIELGRKIFSNANHPKEFYEIDGSHSNGLQYYAQEIADKIYQMILKE